MLNEVYFTSDTGFRNPPVGFSRCAEGVGPTASHLLPGEEHARRRLADRYGLDLTADLRALILGLIARAPNGRHPRACRVELQFRDRERWLVSAEGTILDVVVQLVPGRSPSIVTFLPPSYRWGRA